MYAEHPLIKLSETKHSFKMPYEIMKYSNFNDIKLQNKVWWLIW
jgi:hypothetical protein